MLQKHIIQNFVTPK